MYASFAPQESLLAHLEQLRRDFDDAFNAAPANIRSVAPRTTPAVNVGRTPTSVEVYMFAPGLDLSKLEVTLDRTVLRISGEQVASQPEGKGVHVYARERKAGVFTRAIALPDDIDPARVEANYRDGVLQVSIARSEEAKPRRIAVQ